MTAPPALDPDDLMAEATRTTGLSDFGDDALFGGDAWRTGLRLLVHDLNHESRLHDLGVTIARGDLVTYLATRLAVVDHHRRHPEIRSQDVTPPIVIIGQARTGTTMLFECLAQDPAHRAPLTWEVDRPLPPPRTDTYLTDPRIAETEATFELVDQVVPDFRAIHQMGATRPQECIRFTAHTFMSVIFTSQYRVPRYLDWLMHEAVGSGAFSQSYVWHRRFLEVLQAEHPGERWVVKTAAHCWTLPDLVREYPDALFVQTHRDPARIMASTASLIAHLRHLTCDGVDVAAVAEEMQDYILLGLERTVDARLSGLIGPEKVADVSFYDFMDRPADTIVGVYEHLGLPVDDRVGDRVIAFLAANPRSGDHHYSFANTGLDLAAVRTATQRYVDHFGVHTEM